MYKNILVPLDGSELAECILPHVEAIAKGCGVQNVVFLRVVEPVDMHSGYHDASLSEEEIKSTNSENKTAAEDYLDSVVTRVTYNGVMVKSEVIVGKAAESITEYATNNSVDLVTIASHGRSGISRWVWGSVAERVLRSVCVPVLVVRAPGCVPGF
jgi:nucleotide-binding universal stress UspA family protein